MKYLIVSDIHGDYSSINKIIELEKENNFKNVLFLGDLNYNGARNIPPKDYSPKECTRLLNENKELLDKSIFIRGNCDSRVDEFVLNKEFYDLKKIKLDQHKCVLTHGDLFNKDNYKIKKHTIFMYGHTHIYELTNKDNKVIINPGSISLPKNNNPRTYLIFDSEKDLFSLYNIDNVLIEELKI